MDKEYLVDALFDYVHNGLILVDRAGRIQKMNSRAGELMHVDHKRVEGIQMFEVYSESKLLDIMEKEYTDENIELIINSRKCIASRLPIYDGKTVVGALSVFDDITNFEAINKAWQVDKSENTILKTILELAYDGLIVVDKKGCITMISNAYKKFLGLEDEEVLGKHITSVIENTRMHIVAETGIPETNDVQELNGNYIVATRIPYYEDGELAGAIGKVLFRNVSELDDINKKFDVIEQELKSYKTELVSAHKTKYTLNAIITRNPKMLELKDNVKRISQSKSNVTILGESGTGKELFAHAIHANSRRAHAPFVKVNCAAIPDNLLEAELFGYEKGAFTGANTTKMGKFEVADEGTLFLDEIGDMPLQMQAKILRTLQEGEVERIGSNKPKIVDVRIIAATNKDLKKMIEEKTFREDLYYRINVIGIRIPPLRERVEDIKLLSDCFIDDLNRLVHKNVIEFSAKARNILMSYDWPGNIRELKNVIERAYYILEGESYIEPWHLPSTLKGKSHDRSSLSLKDAMAETERKIIMDRLIAFNSNKTKVSQDLGISRMALHNKLKKYGL
jgi:transcriptional regulator with PAS, ATPase and Fis domain